MQCTIAGNRLILTTEVAPTAPVTLTAEKKNSSRCGVITWTDGQFGIGNGLQDLVTYAETVNDPVVGYLKIEAGQGSVKIVKTSEDGKIDGISFTVTGSNFNETVMTDENGELQLNDLVPGMYTVTENAAAFYEPPQPQTVTVKAGQAAGVFFSNHLQRGALEVTKTAEDGLVQGVTFRLSGTADCGQSVDVYAETDETGIAVFENIPIGSDYTLAEVGAPERYVEVAPQNVRIAWNEGTRQTIENRLVRGSIRGVKVDEVEKPLPGAVFGLFVEGTAEFTKESALSTAVSDASGEFYFADVVFGNYLLRELEAPAGYVLSDKIFEVQITENDAVIELGNLKNKPITGELELTKLDISTGKPLPNAGFRIKDVAGNVMVEGYTDENGIARFTLGYGEYTYEEFAAPEGYLLDTAPHAFSISEDGQIVKAEMTNERIPTPEIPQTGDGSNLTLWLGLGGIVLGGLAVCGILYFKRKKDEK